MDIELNWEWLQSQKLMCCTPMYGGQCYGTYTRSICETVTAFSQRGIPLQLYSLFNESLITRARNYAADEFLRSDCTHLLFIDSDIGYSTQDVICMMSLMKPESPYDIMGAPYPKKCISWEKIKLAVDKGFADKDPRALDQFVGDFVFNPLPGTQSFSILEPAEMLEIGTGFMMIRRSVFEDFQKEFPEYMFRPDHIRTEAFDGHREVCQFFQAEIDRPMLERDYRKALEEIANGGNASEIAKNVIAKSDSELLKYSKRYLSEDYWFCQKARSIGKKVWLCPWMATTHTGTHIYGGTVAAMGALGTSATACPDLLGKNKPTSPPIPVIQHKEIKEKKKTKV